MRDRLNDVPTPQTPLYFGENWHVPALEGARQVPTPVGEVCTTCSEPVQDGDQGQMHIHLVLADPAAATVSEKYRAEVRPIHRECQLASVMSHQLGLCHEKRPELSERERGREVSRMLEALTTIRSLY